MLRNLIFFGTVFFGSAAFADANDGEFLGYKLGENFNAPRGAAHEYHITGALVYVVPPIRHPHHIDSVSLYVSPKSMQIGSVFGEWYFPSVRAAKDFAERYLAALEQKYSHWKRRGSTLTYGNYQLWVDVEEKPPIVDHWPSQKNTRVAIALIFAPDSVSRREWMALLSTEVSDADPSSKRY